MLQENRKRGFTLVEILVVMLLSLIALGMLGRSFVSYKHSYDEQAEVVAMQNDTRIAMHLISSELMMAGYIPEVSGSEPSTDVSGEDFTDGTADNIEEMETNSIAFEGDIDGDDQTETVRYNWSGTVGDPLTREVWSWSGSVWGGSGGAQTVVDEVESLSFVYTPNTSKSDVRQITIQVTTRYLPSEQVDQKRTSTLYSNITPRNLDY